MKRKTEKLSAGVDKRGTGKVKFEKDRRRGEQKQEANREAVGLKLHCWLSFVGLWVSRFVGLWVSRFVGLLVNIQSKVFSLF